MRGKRPKFELDGETTPEALRAALTKHFMNLGRGVGRYPVVLQSGNREFRFYWYTGGRARRGGRLAVKVYPLRWPKKVPVLNALAAEVRSTWSCRHCGTP